MPTYTDRSSAVEVEEFLGTPSSAETFGFTEHRKKARSADRSVNWADIDDDPYWTPDGGQTVALGGDVYERQMAITEGPAQRDAGPWKLVGETRTTAGREALAKRYVRVAVNWEVTSQPGANMRTANGFLMFDEAGSLVKRPAVGEQDLSPVTGSPLFDDQGQPVLVTA